MRDDLIRLACERAADRFGTGNTFNAANFAAVFAEIAGTGGRLDGKYVRAILAGRSDIMNLDGGSHYRIVDMAATSRQHNNYAEPILAISESD